MSNTIHSNKDGVIRAATDGCGQNVQDLCEIMKMEASNRSPHDTGNNANSIACEVQRGRGKIVGRVYTQSGYGGWLEIGTARMAARPYMAPAYQYARAHVK